MRCPACDVAIPPRDLLGHMDRCAGRKEPHPRCIWLSFGDATQRIPRTRLGQLATTGVIRTKGAKGQRRYLERDIVQFLANQKLCSRKRDGTIGPRRKKYQEKTQGTSALATPEMERVQGLVVGLGSVASAARSLGVSRKTLGRAAAGACLRPSTLELIKVRLARLTSSWS